MEIPTNTTIDTALENAVKYAVEELATKERVQLVYARLNINKEQAIKIADMFKAKGYYHEIRMHTNESGRVFFYCLNISKTPIRSNDARFAWSEYVA